MATSSPAKTQKFPKDRPKTANTDSLPHSVEDVTIIWFDKGMDEVVNKEDVYRTKNLLRKINDYVLFFSKLDPFLDYINSVSKERIFLITSGSYAFQHLDKIHPLVQIDSVFIFCVIREKYLPLKNQYSKVIDVFTEQKDLMESLTSNVELITKQAALFGVFDGKERPTRYLTRESASFLWFQLLTDVLKTITLNDTNNTGIKEMLEYCQLYYRGNQVESNNIEEFRKTYKAEDAIIWYSKQSFVYRIINKALRTEDIEALYTFRAYITHLRDQIALEHEHLCRAQRSTKSNIIRLFRGLKMTNAEVVQMRDNTGCLISMNGFFSTSRDVEQATQFATKKSQRTGVVGVLLEIDGDLSSDKMIFADIAQYSTYPQEQEVLFDLAAIFKIVHVEFDKGRNLWIMQLSGAEKSSYVVNDYMKSMRKETQDADSALLFGRVMYDMGEFVKAENYFKRLISTLSKDHREVANILFHLGRVCHLRGEYRDALEYYNEALQLQKSTIKPNEKSIYVARTLHNIGSLYLNQNQIEKALNYFNESLEMKRSLFVDEPNHPSIATTLTAIGTIHRKRGDFTKALELYQESYEMKKLSLSQDHPSIADALNHLGIIYQEMDNNQQALSCYNKALKLQRQNLPPTHPSFSDILNNMGILYRHEGDYDNALKCYNQSLQIEQMTLSPDSLDLADTYSNLCTLYTDLSDYEKALEMAESRLFIQKKHFDDTSEQIKRTKIIIRELKDELDKMPSVAIYL